jgi:hypothetical protein
MRIQSIVGNTCLITEAELFGQPSLRAQWKQRCGAQSAEIRGVSVDEHVAMLRDRLMPLVERFHGLARDGIETIGRVRRAPSPLVERSPAIEVLWRNYWPTQHYFTVETMSVHDHIPAVEGLVTIRRINLYLHQRAR